MPKPSHAAAACAGSGLWLRSAAVCRAAAAGGAVGPCPLPAASPGALPASCPRSTQGCARGRRRGGLAEPSQTWSEAIRCWGGLTEFQRSRGGVPAQARTCCRPHVRPQATALRPLDWQRLPRAGGSHDWSDEIGQSGGRTGGPGGHEGPMQACCDAGTGRQAPAAAWAVPQPIQACVRRDPAPDQRAPPIAAPPPPLSPTRLARPPLSLPGHAHLPVPSQQGSFTIW